MRPLLTLIIMIPGIILVTGRTTPATPLTVGVANPRYFTDGSGKAVYLTGSHTWNNLVDVGTSDPPAKFDYAAYLDFLQQRNHNFIRLWTWETAWAQTYMGVTYVAPLPWARTGPGTALDGKPKFDLSKFDPTYFDRLRQRAREAGKRGIYVSIMFFNRYGAIASDWPGHPFNLHNNINGIDGDTNSNGVGSETRSLQNTTAVDVQGAYIQKVVDTVNDLDNVLYEIANEDFHDSVPWQYHWINYIKDYESRKPNQHPVGMTFYDNGDNKALFDSPADWISPAATSYMTNPLVGDGKKVIILDTDHLWGLGGTQAWVWKSLTRGVNPILMDPYDGTVRLDPYDPAFMNPVRQAMGYTLTRTRAIDLGAMAPRSDLCSSSYCLANPGFEYLVYFPSADAVTVDLSAASGALSVEWFNPTTGVTVMAGETSGGAPRSFSPPFSGDAVLYLSSGSDMRAVLESPELSFTSGLAPIRGWSFDAGAGSGISGIELFINGERIGDVPCCSGRGDVQAAFPTFPASVTFNSGWGTIFNWGLLDSRAHTMRVEVKSARGQQRSETRTVTAVRPGDFEFLDQFDLSQAEVRIADNNLLIAGVRIRDKVTLRQKQIDASFHWFPSSQSLAMIEAVTRNETFSLRSLLFSLMATLPPWLREIPDVALTQAGQDIVAFLETPEDNQPVAGVGIIRGWAFSEDPKASIEEVRLLIDDQMINAIPCCSQRGDVAASFPENAHVLNSGWGATFNYGDLAPGYHTIGVQIRDSAGDSRSLIHTVNVVKPGGFAFLDQFDFSGGSARIEKEEIIVEGIRVRDKASQQTKVIDMRWRWFENAQSLTPVFASS